VTSPELSADPICDNKVLKDVAVLLDVLSDVLDVLLVEELLVEELSVEFSRLVSES
jgi:hypothetical protein